MGHKFAELAFTDAVKNIQSDHGSRIAYSRMDVGDDYNDVLGPNEAQFIAARDSFYMATVSETGWPYVQHRGGPVGFVKILDDRTLGFADYRGNRQYVSVGNISQNERVSLFFMDYPNKTRLKLLGRVHTIDPADLGTLKKLSLDDRHRARTERGLRISVEAFDWNCPQYITPRFTRAEADQQMSSLQAKILELEAKLKTKNVQI
ncbi:pyridoxamine 5'-phosphate oxidase family protein [Ruegeria sp. Alg231-54]|uniref:pyridoxamine 5'-phosphate oxidase family protein n=1 Tax=Ruegeria sp. Alg231-54 TaxID=1922221 RepID=UPI000D555CA2|nr:pyridoxamine 5'-phosphate oxidase family protein [Ruegeria sp. Alg231-54]